MHFLETRFSRSTTKTKLLAVPMPHEASRLAFPIDGFALGINKPMKYVRRSDLFSLPGIFLLVDVSSPFGRLRFPVAAGFYVQANRGDASDDEPEDAQSTSTKIFEDRRKVLASGSLMRSLMVKGGLVAQACRVCQLGFLSTAGWPKFNCSLRAQAFGDSHVDV